MTMPPWWSVRSRRWAAAALLSGAAAALLVLRGGAALRVELLAADDPIARLDAETTERFGMGNPVVWVVVARQGTIWEPPLLEHVRDLTHSVLRMPGVVATEVISLASPNVRDLAVSETTLGATYLLASVPRSPAGLASLRHRVESNENFRGTLVSLDGTAAMIVADFRRDTDASALAEEALRLRDAHRDAATDVWVTGSPLLALAARGETERLAAAVAATAAAGCIALLALAGAAAGISAIAAGAASLLWTAAALTLVDGLVVPWALYAALPIAGIAAALALDSGGARRAVALALGIGFVALGIVAVGPARQLGVAGVLGTLAAFTAASLLGAPDGSRRPPRGFHAWWRDPALLVLLFCLFGLSRLHSSFALFGLGARYLPAAAAADLRAVGRAFPPPAALVLRAHGPAGFVRSPDVLQSFDRLVETARRDRAVTRAMSLADVVKLVNRSFNDGLPEYHVIPSEAATIGRQLSMAYSPAFRRFVDRAFSETAVWIYLHGDDPADLARVRNALQREIDHAPASVEIQWAGGDGAVALRAAELARSLALGWLIFTFAAGAALAVLEGLGRGLRAVAGCCASAALCCGLLGWFGAPIDLVSVAAIGAAAAWGWCFAALGGPVELPVAMAVAGAAGLCCSLLAGSLLGHAAAAALLAPLIVGAVLCHDAGDGAPWGYASGRLERSMGPRRDPAVAPSKAG